VGESVPEFEVESFGNVGKTIRQTDFDKKFLLIYFWGLDSEFSMIELESLEQLRGKLAANSAKVDFVGICLDDKNEIDAEFLKYRKLDWQASSGGREGNVVEQFGVRSPPYYCLVNPEGEIVVSNELFHKLFQTANMQLEAVISQAIDGKDMQKALGAAIKKAGKVK